MALQSSLAAYFADAAMSLFTPLRWEGRSANLGLCAGRQHMGCACL